MVAVTCYYKKLEILRRQEKTFRDDKSIYISGIDFGDGFMDIYISPTHKVICTNYV